MIRKARAYDFEGIERILKEAQELHAVNEPKTFINSLPFSYKEFLMFLDNEDVLFLVYEEEKQIIGFLFGLIYRVNNSSMRMRKLFCIENIAVLKEWQRKHIGKSLIEDSLIFAKKQKCDAVNLNVYEFNDSAKKFYLKLGFRVKSLKMELDLG